MHKLILTLALFLPPTQGLLAQGPTGSIGGIVLTREDGRPLAARVWLVGAARPGPSNAKGTFRFDRLPPGRYHLRATYIGYVPVDTVLSVTAGVHVQIVIRLSSTPVVLAGVTIREAAKPPAVVTLPKPPPAKPPPTCGLLFVVSPRALLCTSPAMLPRTTVHHEKAFFGSNSLILQAALEAVGQTGFVRESLLQLNDATWLIAARDAALPSGARSLRVEVEETGSHDTTVRVSVTSVVTLSRAGQVERAESYLSRIRQNLR
ncbi:MAG TPA: carboxypeptidase regulatory-like domain-containing protein [Gemmatimonadaceae bacterium]|nr:carboxypeptidase regulatory-like domain-containing protein [Gemmatimonadaceae bacterium]